MSYPKASLLALPFTRMELPGWGCLYGSRLVRGHSGAFWSGAPTRRITGKLHNLQMELDLSDWSDRLSYFLGRYYELALQLLLLKCVDRGDRSVDVGANIGLVTLLCAWLVGETGAVDAFEPNPDCLDRLRRHLDMNRIGWVRVFAAGLGDKAGRHELKVPDDHTGVGMLGAAGAEDARWDEEVGAQNVSSERMRKSPLRDAVLASPRLRWLVDLAPRSLRERARGLWRMQQRPEASPDGRAWVEAELDRDLARRLEWLGVELRCATWAQRAPSASFVWSAPPGAKP